MYAVKSKNIMENTVFLASNRAIHFGRIASIYDEFSTAWKQSCFQAPKRYQQNDDFQGKNTPFKLQGTFQEMR